MINSKYVRLLITAGLIVTFFNMLTFTFPIEAQRLLGNNEQVQITNSVFSVITFLTYITLFIRIWKNEHLEKSQKGQWTIFCVLIPLVGGLYFLWFEEKKLKGRKNSS